jgi:hypothetical protein
MPHPSPSPLPPLTAGAGAAFFPADDATGVAGGEEDGGWAEKELVSLRQIAAGVDALRAAEDITFNMRFPSLAALLANLKHAPAIAAALGGGWLTTLARALTNPHVRGSGVVHGGLCAGPHGHPPPPR